MKREIRAGRPRLGQAGPWLVGTLCAAALLTAVGVYGLNSPQAPAVPPTVALPAVNGSAEAVASETVVAKPIVQVAHTTAKDKGVDSQPAQDAEALIASGELGAAADAANAISDEEVKSRIVSQLVRAQIAAGDMAAVEALVRQLPESPSRNAAMNTAAREIALGGGTGADFEPLMTLIQDQTSGLWLDTGDGEGTIDEFESGIRVDPQGVLARLARADETQRLAALGQTARVADLNEDLAAPSTLRMVSLTRLEKEVSRRLAEGQSVAESMQNLAGLSQVKYLFVYPEQGEIVIAGPAEGWRYEEFGRTVGVQSGRPILQLDDMVTLLRTYEVAGESPFGCSIDPRQENLKAVQEYVDQRSGSSLSPAAVRGWANQIGKLLGEQDIRVFGVPANSRVARVMVEADYRMKLIGVDKLDGGSNIPSYFELLERQPSLASAGMNAMRWWMTMKYDAVLHSPNRDTFEIQGSAVRCQSENEFLNDQGQRIPSGSAEPVNREFAQNFTQHYPELAARDHIFADLQGIFDLALVAAMIQQEAMDARLGWDRGSFSNDGDYQTARYATPKVTETVINHRVYNGKDVVLQAAGGVRGDVREILADSSLSQESSELEGIAEQHSGQELPANRWWWDVK